MTIIRNHSSDALNETQPHVSAPVAVIIRPDGSIDVYGYADVIDQRAAKPDDDTACLIQTAHEAVVLLMEFAPDMAAQDLSQRQIDLALNIH